MIRLLYRVQRGEIIDQLKSPYFGLLAQGFALIVTRFSPLSERFGAAAQRDVGTGLQQLLADRSFPALLQRVTRTQLAGFPGRSICAR